jgi:catalase
MTSLLKKLAIFLALFCIVISVFLYFKMQTNALVTTSEVIADDEPAQIQRSVDNFINVIKTFESDQAHRGAHAKGHGCVKAYFDIEQTLPKHLQHGIFDQSQPQFKAWIRFSNGTPRIASDAENDSRGMAIKLLNVRQTGQTQEFLLHNSPAFFSIDLNDYNGLVESPNKIAYFLPSYNPLNWRIRELSHVIETLAPPPASPIWDEYFSNTAYKLGPHNVKYKVQSCSSSLDSTQGNDPDFLRKTLAKELSTDSACMLFGIQIQDADKGMPIEDPSVLWREADSAFIPVATITIPTQQFDTNEQQQFCENLSFSPWKALPEHRPIGALNRVRKLVYQASANYRHTHNKTQPPHNLDW